MFAPLWILNPQPPHIFHQSNESTNLNNIAVGVVVHQNVSEKVLILSQPAGIREAIKENNSKRPVDALAVKHP